MISPTTATYSVTFSGEHREIGFKISPLQVRALLDELGRLSAKILQDSCKKRLYAKILLESCKKRLSAKTQDCDGYLVTLTRILPDKPCIFLVKALKKSLFHWKTQQKERYRREKH